MRQIAVALALSLILFGIVYYVVVSSGEEGAMPVASVPSDLSSRGGTQPSTPQEPRPEVKPIPKRPAQKVKVEVLVVEETGKPVPRAEVRIDRKTSGNETRSQRRIVARFVTNKNGLGVTPEWIEEGYYRFTAYARGFAPTSHEEAVAPSGSQKIVRVKLVLYSGVTISGRVLAEGGRPIEGARVVAYKELGRGTGGGYDWLFGLLQAEELRQILAEAKSDSKGYYVLRGLDRTAVCALRASAQGFAPAERGAVRAGSRNVDFLLQAGTILAGRVESSEGRPIGGATIEAYRKLQQANIRAAVANAMRGAFDSVTSGADGAFEFSTLGEGTFVLVARAPGFQEAQQEVRVYRGSTDAVVFRLEAGLVLAGRVLGPDGTPAEGAAVQVRLPSRVRVAPYNATRDRDPRVSTDAEGTFTIDTLAPGSYTLIVSHPDYATAQIRDVQVPQTDYVVTLEVGGAIGGYVRDMNDQPIAAAVVSCQDLGGVPKEAVSNEEGYYQINGLSVKHGRKKFLNVKAKGYARPENSATVRVEEGKLVRRDFVLTPSCDIVGVVKDTGGNPIENAQVMVKPVPGEQTAVERYLGFAYSREDGSFRISNVAPRAQLLLVVNHPFFLATESEPFDIEPGEREHEVEVQLRVGGSISGVVADQEGNPVSGATVRAVLPGGRESTDVFGGSTSQTGERGEFTVKGLGPGQYEILVSAHGFLEGRSEVIELAEGAGVSGVRVTLTTARSVGGYVRAAGGEVIPKARITVVDASSGGVRKLTAVSEEDGSWRVEGIGNQPVEVSAEAEGFGEATIAGVAPGSQDVVLELPPLGGVRGVVVDRNGRPVRAFSAKPQPESIDQGYRRPRSTRFKTFGNQDGSFQLRDLPPGTYTINIQSPGYRGLLVENVRVEASRVTDIGTVTLLPGGVLMGRVVDPAGSPLAGVRVSVIGGSSKFASGPGKRPTPVVETGPDGTFQFEGLRSGKVKLKADLEGFVTTESEYVDPNTLGSELVITMLPGGEVVGVVIDADRNPVGNIQVYIKGEKGVGKADRTLTNAEGRFRFTGLPSGTYTVRTFKFRKPGEQAVREAVEKVTVREGERVEVVLQRG